MKTKTLSFIIFLSFLLITQAQEKKLNIDFSKTENLYLTGQYHKLETILKNITPDIKKKKLTTLKVRFLLEVGSYDEALKFSKILAESANEDLDYLCLYAEVLMVKGHYKKAFVILTEAREINETHINANLLTYKLAEIMGDFRLMTEIRKIFLSLYQNSTNLDASTLMAIGYSLQKNQAQQAYSIYNKAKKIQKNAQTLLPAAFLCIEKFAPEKAESRLKFVLTKNPNHPMALIAMAELAILNSNFKAADLYVEKSLKINPNLLRAMKLKVELLMVAEYFEESRKIISQMLKINPNDIEALAMQVAYFDLYGQKEKRDATLKIIHKINPRSAPAYNAIAMYYEGRRKFIDAAEWAMKAIQKDRDNWQSYYIAGMNYLRCGEERKGYELLDKSFQLNGFNKLAINTLKILDKEFKSKYYVSFETEHFIIKLHKAEVNLLLPYINEFIEDVYDQYTKKYQFIPKGPKELKGKILFSMYREHNDFSARTVGLPGLGALGACFGQIITMPSPNFAKNDPSKFFNWKKVFEHEFLHVLTLQKSAYHIPRWFTEGLSTWEEGEDRANDRLFGWALRNKKLLSLENLNSGFTRPTFTNEVVLCYFQASLICKYLEKNFGIEKLLQAIDMFKDNDSTTVDIITKITGKKLVTIESEIKIMFAEYAKKTHLPAPLNEEQLKKLKENKYKNYVAIQLSAAWEKISTEHWDDAIKIAKNLVKSNSSNIEVHQILGIASHFGKKMDALYHFQNAEKLDENDYITNLFLGVIFNKSNKAKTYLKKAIKRDTALTFMGLNPYWLLASIYLKHGENEKAKAVFLDLVKKNPRQYQAFLKLAEIAKKQKLFAESAKYYLAAFYINPYDFKIHLKAADVSQLSANHKRAAIEFSAVVALDPRNEKGIEGAVASYLKIKDFAKAAKFLRKLKRHYPKNKRIKQFQKQLES